MALILSGTFRLKSVIYEAAKIQSSI